MSDAAGPLLQVEGLRTQFVTEAGLVTAVDGVSFHVERGEVVGIVGESGCGKSVTNLSILGLLPKPQGRIAAGSGASVSASAFATEVTLSSRGRRMSKSGPAERMAITSLLP